MSIVFKGFPTEISDYIEIPDIAELLTYPIFYDTDIDEAYKYGTQFQRKLIDMTPLRGNKRTTSVLFEVRLLIPDYRSCTGNNPDPNREWHIDCEEMEDGKEIYHEERDTVHLLTNQCTTMTEFNKNELILDLDPSKVSYNDFHEYIYNNRSFLKLESQSMPANRIVTFTNHMHRATNSSKPEFRFMYRVVETDRKRPANPFDPFIRTTITNKNGQEVPNIEKDFEKISIYIPSHSVNHEPIPSPLTKNNGSNNQNNSNIKPSGIQSTIKELVIDKAYWECSGLSFRSTMYDFTPKDSIMLIAFKDFSGAINREFDKFCQLFDRNVTLISSTGETIEASLVRAFFENDYDLGLVAGTFIQLSPDQVKMLKRGEEYKIEFSKDAEYKLVASDDLKFIF